MTWTANGFNGLDRYDDREAFYREQERERHEREKIEETARWIAGRMHGQTFTSLPELEFATVGLAATLLGGEPNDAIAGRIKKACVLLWLGRETFDSSYRRCVVKEATGIKFLGAA